LAYTKSKAERDVAFRLEQKGIFSYVPLQKVYRQWSDRKKKIEVPLFNSYVFINVCVKDYFKALNTTGLVKFISIDYKPVVVRESDIEKIKKTVARYTDIVVTQEKFKIGSRVEFIEGNMKGYTGLLVEYRGKSRVAVGLDSIDFSMLVEVPAHHIRLCKK